MATTTVFRVLLPNRPGEIAQLAGRLADVGVNIQTGAAVANGREAYFEFGVSDEDATVRVLKERGAPYQKVPVLLVWIEDSPGELARVLAPLSNAGVNVDSLYLVRSEGTRNLLAIGCSDLEKAGQLLSGVSADAG